MTKLDLITVGRSSVDLYGAQIGGRLEDMRSFDKYIGVSPTNIAFGTARLGLKSAVITGVGDEHIGRFICEELLREGVDGNDVKIDPDRLTALVLLGIRDQEQFPLIFCRENCADMGLTVDDIDPDFIRSARAVVATGTHLSHPQVDAITRNDPHTRGIVVLGLDASEDARARSFAVAAGQRLVKGFAIGRTIFGDAARAWIRGQITDALAVSQMADRFARLCSLWDTARAKAQSTKEDTA